MRSRAELCYRVFMPQKHRVTQLTRTGESSPAQWEGITEDGRGIYVRYGGGELSIYLGDPEDGPELAEANGRLILLKVVDLDDFNAGTMTLAELKSHTAGFIDWPAKESDPVDSDE